MLRIVLLNLKISFSTKNLPIVPTPYHEVVTQLLEAADFRSASSLLQQQLESYARRVICSQISALLLTPALPRMHLAAQ